MDEPGTADGLDQIRWDFEPSLRRPVVVAAFEGDNRSVLTEVRSLVGGEVTLTPDKHLHLEHYEVLSL